MCIPNSYYYFQSNRDRVWNYNQRVPMSPAPLKFWTLPEFKIKSLGSESKFYKFYGFRGTFGSHIYCDPCVAETLKQKINITTKFYRFRTDPLLKIQ